VLISPPRAIARHSLILTAILLSSPAWGEDEREIIDLVPDERAGWSATNLFAPVTSLFLGGPNYWYGERVLEIDTTPPNAVLDLFYVRANFQKRFEQGEAPARVLLPPRVEAGPRDSVTIRVLADGYRHKELSVRVRSRESRIQIDLDPLPNSLVAVRHIYFAGRATLSFLTQEALTFRLQNNADGFSVVLTETANSPHAEETLEGVEDGLIESILARQLGEDLVVQVALHEGSVDGMDVRSLQDYDAIRALHSFTLNLVPSDRGAGAVRRARAALARLRSHDVQGCALGFDTSLREQLDPAELARALAPRGAFTDPYLRAAMKRLGELSPNGAVVLNDGTRYRVAVPIELSAAWNQASEVRGYLALLRSFVAALESPAYRTPTLRGLVAPEVGAVRFQTILDTAEKRERSCRAKAG
jgi:hypothetical protein